MSSTIRTMKLDATSLTFGGHVIAASRIIAEEPVLSANLTRGDFTPLELVALANLAYLYQRIMD